MINFKSTLVIVAALFMLPLQGKEVRLKGPKGWECLSDPAQLPKKVKMLYVGAARNKFTPSLNVAFEATDEPLSSYVLTAKAYHESVAQTVCKSLGMVKTQSGEAHVLQIDRPTTWGDVRFIQATLIQDRTAYVITATCLKEEFAEHFSSFVEAVRSFEIKK